MSKKMYGGDDLNALIDAAIDDAPRLRTSQTASALAALLEALTKKVESRAKFRGQYAKTAATAGTHDERAAMRPFEGNYDAADDNDILTGAWLRRVSTLSSKLAALEPTVAAVIDAVLFCDKPTDVKSALKHLDAAAAKDKKIHADRARQLVREYPPYGSAAQVDRDQTDWSELGKKREAQDKAARS